MIKYSVLTNIYVYNSGAAATYAMNNWDNKELHSDYYVFNNDCTNFVSQCEKAGDKHSVIVTQIDSMAAL